jgi:hypothetical protein
MKKILFIRLGIRVNDYQLSNSYQSSLTKLSHVRYLVLLSLPKDDLAFFERLINVTPNLNRLSVYFDDLLEIIHVSQHNLCQILQKYIYQLEIHFDYSWSYTNIRRDIPKILRIFSNIKSLTISFHSSQKFLIKTTKELLIHLFKHQTNLICINIDGSASIGFDSISKQGGIQLIKTWLNTYLNNSIHIQLNSSSITLLS